MTQNQAKLSRRGLIAILAVAVLSFIGILTETSLNVAFPTIMKQFDVKLATVQWLTTGYLLMVSLLMIVSAFLNKRFKTRSIFITAVSFFMLGSIIAAVAPTFGIILLGRIISAAGTGLCIPLMFNVIVETVPVHQIGYYMGIAGMVLSMAPAFGPTFGGVMVYFLSWRMIFWIVVPFAIIALIFGMASLEQHHDLSHPDFDWVRYCLLAVAFVSLSLGFNSVSTAGWLGKAFLGSVVLAAIMLWFFIRISKTTTKMLLNINVFKSKTFVSSLIAYFFLQFANIGMSFVLPTYVQIVNHQSALIGGLILLPGSFIASAATPLFGKMLDDKGAKLPILLGNSIFTAGLIGFVFGGKILPIGLIIIFYLIFTFGRSMVLGNTMTFGLTGVSNELRADANASFTTAQQFAGSIGTTILASIISISQNSGQSLPQYQLTAIGSRYAFATLLVLALINFGLYHQVFKKNECDN